jgi:hypothetical protein
LGCSSVNLTNTTALYARYTTTVLCNAIVQSSRQSCGLSSSNATPLCAGACVGSLFSHSFLWKLTVTGRFRHQRASNSVESGALRQARKQRQPSDTLRLYPLLEPCRGSQWKLYCRSAERAHGMRLPGQSARTVHVLRSQYRKLHGFLLCYRKRRTALCWR